METATTNTENVMETATTNTENVMETATTNTENVMEKWKESELEAFNSYVKIVKTQKYETLEKKQDNVIFASLLNGEKADIEKEKAFTILCKVSGFYKCEQLTEWAKEKGLIMPDFLKISVDQIMRNIRAGKYKVEKIGEKMSYVKYDEPSIHADKIIFDAIYHFCKRFEQLRVNDKKNKNSLVKKVNEIIDEMKNAIGAENKGIFTTKQKELKNTLDEIRVFNNKTKYVDLKIEINTMWTDHEVLEWSESPDFKKRIKSETQRMIQEESQKTEKNRVKYTHNDVWEKWLEYKKTIKPEKQTKKQEAIVDMITRMLQNIK